ncbi:MAG TPA: anti-sigma factor [Nitrospirota bacterium]|nr:anti-sigma factor [Nitrospirota bacterium]
MKCLKTEHISAYLDNALEEKEKASVEAHLKGCARCAEELEEMKSLRRAFSAAERFQAPYGFATRVVARAAELDKKKTPWFVPVFTRFVEAAVLVLVIVVGIAAGTFITKGLPSQRATNLASSMSLDLFDAAPPGSLGGAYLAMTEANHEK